MGCSNVRSVDGQGTLMLKSEPLTNFFKNCQSYGFSEVYVYEVRKRTIYEYQYVKGLRDWIMTTHKDLFDADQPVYLSPCQPQQFDEFIKKIYQYKLQMKKQFQGFPRNIGMLLSAGSQFPQFKTELFGHHEQITLRIANSPTIFVHWKLTEKLSMSKYQHTTQKSGLFKTLENSNKLETSLERARQSLNILNVDGLQIKGIAYDESKMKNQYENHLNQFGFKLQDHIWIEKTKSPYDTEDIPYDNQAFQVFRYAQNQGSSDIIKLDGTIYLVSSEGIFLGAFKENFGDPHFCNHIRQIFQTPKEQKINEEQEKEKRVDNYKKLLFEKNSIRRDDYQRLKRLLQEGLPNQTKGIHIGDTFRVLLEKHTFFCNYKKLGATYCEPVLNAASSPKYQENLKQLIAWIKSQIAIAHIQKDFRRRITIDKVNFFANLSTLMKKQGWDDVRFILERYQRIFYSQQYGKFIIERKIDQLYNAPLSVGAVFARSEKGKQIYSEILQSQDKFDHSELQLLKQFLGNTYIFATAFSIGHLYCPIPNVYRVSKMQEQTSRSIFQRPSETASILEDNKSIDSGWDGRRNQADLSYEQTDVLSQYKMEILVIIQVDFQNQKQLYDLQQLIEFLLTQNYSNEVCRVASIGVSFADEHFENALKIHQIDQGLVSGIYEPWFCMDKIYLNAHFNKLLNDLYGLNSQRGDSIIVIDQHRKLAYRGAFSQGFPQILGAIINGNHSKTVYSYDNQFRTRIKLACYEKEWNKLKAFGYLEMKNSKVVQNVEAYLQINPPRDDEFWKIEIRSFQLWNENGKLFGKFYEKPKIGYRLYRPELISKFELVQKEIVTKLGEEKVEVNDLHQTLYNQQSQSLSSKMPQNFVTSIYVN